MTGIERLRELGKYYEGDGNLNVKMVGHELLSISDQIESEHVSRMRVLAVVTDMERHVSGVEGAEDSPVARWARELRDALRSDTSDAVEQQNPSCADPDGAADVTSDAPKVTRDPAEDVSAHLASDAALYDLRREVRDLCEAHGVEPGEDPLQAMGEALDRRLVPEGMEWPHDAKGVPIVRGETVWANGSDSGDGRAWHVSRVCPGSAYPVDAKDARGERRDLKPRWLTHERPAPKVLDADGVEIRVGDTVWHVETGEQCKVVEVDSRSVSVDFRVGGDGAKHTGSILPANLTHRAPVLAADGRPLREGETVWYLDHIDPLEVRSVSTTASCGSYVTAYNDYEGEVSAPARCFFHERPDSLDRLAEDIGAMVVAWRSNKDLFDAQEAAAGCVGENTMGAALDSLVRRAKALAGGA